MTRITTFLVLAATSALVVSCKDDKTKTHTETDDNGDTDEPGGFADPAEQCAIEDTPVGNVEVSFGEFIPGTATILAFGATDAKETVNAYTYDTTNGAIRVLTGSLPMDRGVSPSAYVHDRAVGMAPSGEYALVKQSRTETRTQQLYMVAMDGRGSRLIGNPTANVYDAWPSADATRALTLAADVATGYDILETVDVASGGVTRLFTADSADAIPAIAYGDLVPRYAGDRVVFAVSTGENSYALNSVNTDGTGLLRLSPADDEGLTVGVDTSGASCGYQVAPRGDRVVYTFGDGDADVFELRAVGADGTSPVTLSPLLAEGDFVSREACPITRDDRVAYLVVRNHDTELHLAALDGSSDVILDSGSIYSHTGMWLTPAHDAVLYIADDALKAARLDGGEAVTLASDIDDRNPRLLNERVVFKRSIDGDGGLWSVRYDGTGLVPLVADGLDGDFEPANYYSEWLATADEQWILAATTTGTRPDIQSTLVALRSDGSASRKLTDASFPIGYTIQNIALEPSSGRFVLVAGPAFGTDSYLYRGSIDGTAELARRCALNAYDIERPVANKSGSLAVGPLTVGWYGNTRSIVSMRYNGSEFVRHEVASPADAAFVVDSSGNTFVTDDGRWFAVGTYDDRLSSFYTINADDGTSHAFVPSAEMERVERAVISPDATHVAFMARGTDVKSLWVASIDGSDAHRLTTDNQVLEFVNEAAYRFTKDSKSIVFLAAPTTADGPCSPQPQLFIVNVDGSDNRQINSPLVTCGSVSAETYGGSYVFNVAFTADGESVIYSATADSTTTHALYRARLDGTSDVRLTPPSGDGSNVETFTIGRAFTVTPDGTRILYVDRSGNDTRLWSMLATGGAPALIGPSIARSNEFTFAGNRVIYWIEGENGSYGLASGNIDGGDPATIITPEPWTLISPTVLGIVGDDVYVLMEHGITKTKLDHPAQAVVLDLVPYTSSPLAELTGNEILFVHDYAKHNVPELFSLSLADGAVTRVGPEMTLGGGVSNLIVGPNGAVLIVADSVTPGVQDFVRVR